MIRVYAASVLGVAICVVALIPSVEAQDAADICCELVIDSPCLQLSADSGTCSAASCVTYERVECSNDTSTRCNELSVNAAMGSEEACTLNRTTQLFPQWAAAQVLADFGYDGDAGPANWGLAPGAALCATGRQQSPINLDLGSESVVEAEDTMALSDVASHAEAEFVTAQSKGAPRYDCAQPTQCGNMTLNSVTYDLVQFHMHAKSEHGLAGLTLPMEVHFVHQSRDDPADLAVLGVFVELGPENNTALQRVLSADTVASSGASVRVDPSAIYVGEMGYWQYNGSLTTPPCSEGVAWVLSKVPALISAGQWGAYWEHIGGYPGNARDWQPLSGRRIRDIASDVELSGPPRPSAPPEPSASP